LIKLFEPYISKEESNATIKVIQSKFWASGSGINNVKKFENAFLKYTQSKSCVSVNSGTAALNLALSMYDIKGKEVILPSLTFVATANACILNKAKPIFADIEDTTFGLDPKSILNKITDNTKAVMPMDYGGMACKIFEIKKITKDKNLTLIEDAAESLGASINGHKVGSLADSSIFSFCGNKVLTTGEGGAVVTNSREIYEKIKLIRSHGRFDKINYFSNASESQYVQMGYNWRMSSITAALGISQLQKLDKIIQMRKENAKYISLRLSKFSEIQVPNTSSEVDHIFQMYTIRLRNKKIRDELHEFLTKKRIFSKTYFNPIHLTEFYQEKFGTTKGMLPVTEKLSQEVLTLPIYPNMTLEEKEYLIQSISEFFESLDN